MTEWPAFLPCPSSVAMENDHGSARLPSHRTVMIQSSAGGGLSPAKSDWAFRYSARAAG